MCIQFKDDMNKKRFWFLFLVLGIYLITISFPIYLLTNDIYVRAIVMLSLRSAYLVFIILFSIFAKLIKGYNGSNRLKNILLLLPVFVVAFMDLFYWGVISHSTFSVSGGLLLGLKIATIIVTVLEEELLFRLVVQKNLMIGHKIIRILISASIFAFAHIFTILFGGFPTIYPIELLQLIVLFVIGIILGFLYEYTNNIFVPISFNLIYSFCTDLLFHNSFFEASYKYYITICSFLLFGVAYLHIFYFLMLKKENR